MMISWNRCLTAAWYRSCRWIRCRSNCLFRNYTVGNRDRPVILSLICENNITLTAYYIWKSILYNRLSIFVCLKNCVSKLSIFFMIRQCKLSCNILLQLHILQQYQFVIFILLKNSCIESIICCCLLSVSHNFFYNTDMSITVEIIRKLQIIIIHIRYRFHRTVFAHLHL